MRPLASELAAAVEGWERRLWPRPVAAVVSGSGLAVDLGRPLATSPLGEWLPFPAAGVAGHPLTVELLEPRPGRAVVYFRGRLHSYQGFDAHQTVFPIRLAGLLGARMLLMTNAAGGLQPDQEPGDLVLVRDHINLTGLNPLRGELPPEWGPRFPDLGEAYEPTLRAAARTAGDGLGIALGEGVYAGLAGPNYETPAEVEMLRRAGADLVGMSTVLEVIAARHLGLACLCLSLVANRAAGVGGAALEHEEVLAAGRAAAGQVQSLLAALLAEI